MTEEDTKAQYVPPGMCTWCGHPPHMEGCPKRIRLGKKRSSPCPCQHERGA